MSINQSLPERPNLEYLKDQAKRLLKACHRGDPDSLSLVAAFHPRFQNRGATLQQEPLALHDAQVVLARQYGFPSWSRLKQEVETRTRPLLSPEEALVQAVFYGRVEEVESALADRPRWDQKMREELRNALAGTVNRSVWHRPQYHRMAKALVAHGVECSIWDAARLGLLEHVQTLVARNRGLLEARDERHRTPLQRAALIYGSHPECEATVAWLVSQGVEVDLFTAAAYSMADRVAAHLKKNPGAVHERCQGSTPLNWAVRPRFDQDWPAPLETCALLINAGSALDTTDLFEEGMQPLHHLAEWGNRDALVDWFMERGADLAATSDLGWTPLDYAIDRNRTNLIACLRRHGATQTLVEWPNAFGARRDLILASVKRNDLATVRRLLSEDRLLANARETDGATPLHWAAHDGFYEIAEFLLRHGADVHAQETTHWGGTPLHWAAERQPVIVELLLEHGADVNARNCRTEQTPLHYCARCDDVVEVAKLLLARGANPHLVDRKNKTPLDYAVQNEHSEVADFLRGAESFFS